MRYDALLLDLVQLTLDLAGIVEPTPFADGTNALISLARRRWVDAALSGVGMVPYIGDLAKAGKLTVYLRSLRQAIDAARHDAGVAAHLRPALERLKQALDRIPVNALPERARGQVEEMRTLIHQFLHAAPVTSKAARTARWLRPFADFPSFQGKPIKEVLAWLRKNGFEEVRAPVVSRLGKTEKSQIWFRRHASGDGPDLIEAVRIDARGQLVKNVKKEDKVSVQHYGLVDVKVASGEPRHIHKELIDSSMVLEYFNNSIQRNGKRWTAPSFDDLNQPVASGDHAASHIWVVP